MQLAVRFILYLNKGVV